MQQGAQVVVVPLGPGGVDGPGGLGLGAQAGRAFGGEGVGGVAHGLGGAAESGGDPGGALPLGAGQRDSAAAQGGGVGGAQALTEGGALGAGQGPHEQRWFHTSFYAPDTTCKDCPLRLH
jgi:hypothetical protein